MDNEMVNEISELQEGNNETVLEEFATSGESIDTSMSDNVDTVSNQLSDADIAEALRNFIENYSSPGSESYDSDPSEETDVQNDTSVSESSSIDYSEILNDLYQVAEDNSTTATSILNYLEVQEENNKIDTSMNDVSLTNIILIAIMGVLMFGSCLLYARRIF